MELRHLRYFVAVAEALSFTRGAQKLNLSQPSLTRQIQDLEEEIGVRLLERSKGGVSLTRQGTTFLVDAKRVLDLSEEIVASVRRSSAVPPVPLNIGYVADLFYDLLPVTLAAFQRLLPLVPVNLFDMNCGDQFRALEDGRIDVGFVGLREPIEERGLKFESIASYTTVVALAKNNALARKSVIQGAETIVFHWNVGGQLSGISALAHRNVSTGRICSEGPAGRGDRANRDPGRRGRIGHRYCSRPGKETPS